MPDNFRNPARGRLGWEPPKIVPKLPGEEEAPAPEPVSDVISPTGGLDPATKPQPRHTRASLNEFLIALQTAHLKITYTDLFRAVFSIPTGGKGINTEQGGVNLVNKYVDPELKHMAVHDRSLSSPDAPIEKALSKYDPSVDIDEELARSTIDWQVLPQETDRSQVPVTGLKVAERYLRHAESLSGTGETPTIDSVISDMREEAQELAQSPRSEIDDALGIDDTEAPAPPAPIPTGAASDLDTDWDSYLAQDGAAPDPASIDPAFFGPEGKIKLPSEQEQEAEKPVGKYGTYDDINPELEVDPDVEREEGPPHLRYAGKKGYRMGYKAMRDFVENELRTEDPEMHARHGVSGWYTAQAGRRRAAVRQLKLLAGVAKEFGLNNILQGMKGGLVHALADYEGADRNEIFYGMERFLDKLVLGNTWSARSDFDPSVDYIEQLDRDERTRLSNELAGDLHREVTDEQVQQMAYAIIQRR